MGEPTGRAPESTPASSARARRRATPRTLILVSWAVGAAFAAPFGYLAWRTADIGSDAFDLLADAAALAALGRTLLLAATVSVTAAVLGTGLAWLAVRTDLPGRRALRVLAPLPLVFPSFVGAASLLAAFAPGGLLDELLGPLGIERLPRVDGFLGAWIVLSLLEFPYVYLPVVARLAGLPPSIEESARLLGRRPAAVFAGIVLPQLRPAIRAGGLLVFLYTVSDFGAVELMRYGTLTREIYAARLFDPASSVVLSLLLAAVALVVVVGERASVRGAPVVAGTPSPRRLEHRLGRWRWPAFGAVVVVLANALFAPLAVLAFWAWRARHGTALGTLGADFGGLGEPALRTGVAGVVTAVVALVVVLPVAYLAMRHRSRWSGAPNALIVAGFALPGLVLALALAFWTLRAPGLAGLYQTFPLLVFAYVVHFGAQSLRAAQVAVGAVPRRLEDAARMLGAGRVRRLRTVELPLMLPGLMAGAGLVLLSTMKELPATLLLAPAEFETLATRIWHAAEYGALGAVGVTSLLLVAVSAVLTWVLVVRRAEGLR